MEDLTAPERGMWVSATGKVRVEYPHRVLEEIRAATVQGLCRFPRGGLEVGGVLLGSVRDGVVRVIAARPVECSYARGPSFSLTEADEAAFRKIMSGTGADLKPVGWYHSHTRSDLGFSPDDAAVHERLFPEPWQFALVVHPEPFGSAEAAFFARGDAGAMEPVPHGTLLLRPAARHKAGYGARRTARIEGDADEVAPPVVQVLELETAAEPGPATSASTSEPDSPVPATRPEGSRPVEHPFTAPLVTPAESLPPLRGDSQKRSHRVVWAGVGALALLAAVVIYGALNSRSAPPVPPHLSLQVAESNGQLRITWDRNSAPLKYARGGSVHIRDGGQDITVPFNAERLRAGALTYARTSQDVEVRLRVEGSEPVEESVRLFGPPVEPGSVTPAPAAAPAPKVVEPPSQPLEQRLQPPAEGVKVAAAKTEPVADAAAIRTDEPDREPAPPRPFRPAMMPERAQARVALPQPPPVQGAPSLARDDVGIAVPSAGPPPQPRAEPSQKPAPAPPVSAPVVPASGRLIWVGRLERGGRLSIEGQRASSGVVTGELPGVPVRISAYPAELGDAGLRVFASSPGLRGSREAAGPQNGWNPTVYAWDARRSTDVLVTEVPSAENGWRGISVRGNGQAVSVIVIEWRAAHP